MNYPVWDVSFGAGLLIAIVAVVHIFVSHFAVGGGLFLVLTEKKAYRENDTDLLTWLKSHTKFFVLVTVVFGAVSGVAIWFTIGLIQPSATSNLIHAYVWGWAIEWVFFFLEITAALLYLHGWERLSRKKHLWYGWIYFIAAFASMVIINGIICFMLTPGEWLVNRAFWYGFFNPTFFPSLFIRFAFSISLAGIYALITAGFQKKEELKGKIVIWSGKWTIPAFILLPVFAYWYVGKISPDIWVNARGIMPTATRYTNLLLIFSILTFVFALVTLIRPRKHNHILTVLVVFCAFITLWSFEFVRESIRKPYIITGFIYGNSLYQTPMPGDGGFTVENINKHGVLNVAKWVQQRKITPENKITAGHEIFRVQCQSCHTPSAYRGLSKYLIQRGWNEGTFLAILGSVDLIDNGVMPPFAGSEEEKQALAAYIFSLLPHPATISKLDGQKSWKGYCAPCHQYKPDDAVFTVIHKVDEKTALEILTDLSGVYVRMPDLKISEEEQKLLVKWIKEQFN